MLCWRKGVKQILSLSFLEENSTTSPRFLGAIHGRIGLANDGFYILFLKAQQANAYTSANR